MQNLQLLVKKTRKSKEGFEELYNAIAKTVYYHCYKALGNK